MQFDHTSGKRWEHLYYQELGEGEPWLLLHGGFGTLEDWNPFLPHLTGRRLIALDSRGHGGSGFGDRPLSYQALEEDAGALLDHLGLTDVSVLGFSDGGITALRLGLQRPLRQMVVMAASYRLPSDLSLLKGVTAESWKAKFPETYEIYQRVSPAPDFDRLARESVAMWVDEGPSGHPGERVRELKCPLLLVRGDDDHLVSRQSVGELRDLVEGSHFLNVPRAGHVVYLDQPEMVALALTPTSR